MLGGRGRGGRGARGTDDYLLPSEGDHIQGAVHEAPGHQLGSILREHSVTHAMVGRDILNGKQTQPSFIITVQSVQQGSMLPWFLDHWNLLGVLSQHYF